MVKVFVEALFVDLCALDGSDGSDKRALIWQHFERRVYKRDDHDSRDEPCDVDARGRP